MKNLFVFYKFPRCFTYFDQIWHDGRGPPWGTQTLKTCMGSSPNQLPRYFYYKKDTGIMTTVG
jgi:hypothetical protein